jgi:hypothetical protein
MLSGIDLTTCVGKSKQSNYRLIISACKSKRIKDLYHCHEILMNQITSVMQTFNHVTSSQDYTTVAFTTTGSIAEGE